MYYYYCSYDTSGIPETLPGEHHWRLLTVEFYALTARNVAHDSSYRRSAICCATRKTHFNILFAKDPRTAQVKRRRAGTSSRTLTRCCKFWFGLVFLKTSEAVTETGGLSLLTSSQTSLRRCKTVQLLLSRRREGKQAFLLPLFYSSPGFACRCQAADEFVARAALLRGKLTALIRESSTLTAKAVPQAKGWVRYSSVSGSSSSSWSRN